MYAVIKTGGKQYKVAKDQIVTVEKLAAAAGDSVAFDQVLLVGEDENTILGAPYVAGASVMAEVVEQTRGDKIIVFKKKRRKNHRRRNGHRQHETVLRITEILTDGKTPAKAAKPKAEPKASAEPEAESKPATEDKAAAEPAAEGRRICIELIQGLRETPGVAGVHVKAPRQSMETVAQIIEDSGVRDAAREAAPAAARS